jgi:adenine-specific DNA-methyltransferase
MIARRNSRFLRPIDLPLFPIRVANKYRPENDVTLHCGDCLDFLSTIPNGSADLVVTSPPYNLGKVYEKRLKLSTYVDQQSQVIRECIRILALDGNLCWQVGNFVTGGAIVPLDAVLFPVFAEGGLQMRNRIIWHFEHGLHCSRRFSGRYEVIAWFTKTNHYVFDLDAVRVPQKYPGKKHFKGPRAGEFSCNPNGKNPGDVWIIPNVKHNHVEKTAHPCQFPVELVERLVLAMSRERGLVVDPFMGVGTTAVAAILHRRRAAGAEVVQQYHDIAVHRIQLAAAHELPTRPMNRSVYQPSGADKVAKNPFNVIERDAE